MKNFNIEAYDRGYTHGFLERLNHSRPSFKDIPTEDRKGVNGYFIGYMDGRTMGEMELQLGSQQEKARLNPENLIEQEKLSLLEKEWGEWTFIKDGYEEREEARLSNEREHEDTEELEISKQKELDEIRLEREGSEMEHDPDERDLGE